ncbi:poly(ethylene terephthalate) hydrolase family protein [Aquimarina sp. 2201CG14-23]|uniref:poly(ethylene terephthalate) hydrolase family protein n=1 Tax=Aquimarina mycalae TaxID=3040073 RepID=UPI002477F218|nr:T9SS type A sorting domain-containing protein [Aquimarina sp. 2201CG14-23]MDH7446283.1 T9SS type A sorting domain-containing protein [Aquimarina sp. 2201CG14-23]
MKNLFFTLLAFILMTSGAIAQYDVGSSSKTFRDSDRRNRRVNARIYYPTVNFGNQSEIAEGQFPVIILGHGFIMGSDAYQNFYDTLVPRGYIVVFVNTEGSFFANHRAFSEDLAFMVGAIQAENDNSNSVLYQSVADKSALIGHSMGGGAATVAASLTDVETLVTFAPAKLRFNTLTPASQVTEDAIVFSGSGDAVTPADENHIPIYNSLGSSCKYFINILGGAHCYYANSNFACDFGENTSSGDIQITRDEQQEIVFNFLNSWFDYKLKDDLAAKQKFANDLQSSDDVAHENDCAEGVNTISSIENEPSILITPNPASRKITIGVENKKSFQKVEFYNQQGVKVFTSFNNEANVSNLKSGGYIVRIYTNNAVTTKQIIIQK